MITSFSTLKSFNWCISQIGREHKSLSHGSYDLRALPLILKIFPLQLFILIFLCLLLTLGVFPTIYSASFVACIFCNRTDKLQLEKPLIVDSPGIFFNRRVGLFRSGALLVSVFTLSCGLTPSPISAEEKSQDDEGDNGVLGSIKSLLDPNEKTKSGKILPKAYLKSAREVVKTLRESLQEDAKDVAKFRRTADSAKESIRDFLSGWRGQQAVVAEESYVALEKAIRSLANFYSKAGPFAILSEEVKRSILDDLSTAEANL